MPRVTRTVPGRWRWSFRRISIAIGTSAITLARSAVSSPLVASRPAFTMAGPLSPFRPSVSATNDPNRLGFPFCQPSGARSHEDLHRPLSNTLPITVRISRSRRKMSSAPAAPLVDASHTTDGWKSLGTGHPTSAALVAEGADVDPWRLVLDGGAASALPVPGLFSQATACAGYAATRSEDLVDPLAHHGRCDRRRWSAHGSPQRRWSACVQRGRRFSTTSRRSD